MGVRNWFEVLATDPDRLHKLLGIAVAFAWPVYTVLPDDRFGGVYMLNGLLYGLLLLLCIAILTNRGSILLACGSLLFLLLFYLPTAIHAAYANNPGGVGKSVDTIVTHSIFVISGIAAGRNFPVFVTYFIRTLLAIIAVNLALALYPDLVIEDRESIGFFGGQGFARIVSIAAVGLIITSRISGPLKSALGSGLVFVAASGLILFTGARSSLLGVVAALVSYFAMLHRKFAVLSLLSAIGILLGAFLVSLFYLDNLRPILLEADPESGIVRTFLTLDIFFIDQVGTEKIASVMERLTLWQDSLRIAKDHPLGTGFGGFYKFATLSERTPHNLIFEILVEMGMVLGAIYLTVITILFILSPRAILPYLIVLAALFMFSGDFVDFRQMLFFLAITLYLLYAHDSPESRSLAVELPQSGQVRPGDGNA